MSDGAMVLSKQHLPVGVGAPSEEKAAGDELRDDSGARASRSCEQSGLAGSFSILAHYFATSSASFRANLTLGGRVTGFWFDGGRVGGPRSKLTTGEKSKPNGQGFESFASPEGPEKL